MSEESWKWYPVVLVVLLLACAGLSVVSLVASTLQGEARLAAWNAVVVMVYCFIAGYVTRLIHKEVKK